MRKDDFIRLQHMLDAAREALAFTEGKARGALDGNRMLVLSLVKSIEIIGEAATKVSAESREAQPEIPWASIVAMRNRLIHAYFDVDLDRVWDTMTDDLPHLLTLLERIVPTNDK